MQSRQRVKSEDEKREALEVRESGAGSMVHVVGEANQDDGEAVSTMGKERLSGE
jgi:hypothetical protein|tara:strand:- start:6631 stop:6792 length:162 start_codon:yes stop_codon:yes gene_type:complete